MVWIWIILGVSLALIVIALLLDHFRNRPAKNIDWYGEAQSAPALVQYASVIEWWDSQIRRDPTNPDNYFQRGLAHQALGQWEQAGTDFTEAIRLQDEGQG